MNKYSVTSNEIKLYKHMDSLQKIQMSKSSPILLHLSPTNRCNQKCLHCCFAGREKNIELDINSTLNAIWQFKELGIKSVEITGGGETTLYSHINELIDYIVKLDLALGINTNALDISRIKHWEKFTWVRAAFNAFDSDDDIDKFKRNVIALKDKSSITSCYIVSQQLGVKNLHQVIEFANESKIYTRIAPDCIQGADAIQHTIANIQAVLNIRLDNKYAFCSDFNVYLYEPEICAIHMIKPFLYTDGYVYCCPSSELAVENNRTMQPKYRVCHMSEVKEFYNSKKNKPFDHKCSYCKYAAQNNILNAILTETNDNEFV